MNGQGPGGQRFDFDFAPALKMYLESVESWKKNYEQVMQNANLTPVTRPSDMVGAAYEQAVNNWQRAGETLFKRFIEQQIELCRFFENRLKLFLDMPARFAQCKTPAEAAQLHMEFMNRLSQEYAQESAKLIQPMSQLMTQWTRPF